MTVFLCVVVGVTTATVVGWLGYRYGRWNGWHRGYDAGYLRGDKDARRLTTSG